MNDHLHRANSVLVGVLCLGLVSASAAEVDQSKLPPPAVRPVDFARDIKPIFDKSCVPCHGADKHKGGFRLDSPAALKGGDNYAPSIIPGKSAGSPLIHFVAGLVDDMLMPSKGERLTAEQIGLLRAWIDQGAQWPVAANAAAKTEHWAFKPVARPAPPKVANPRWPRNPVDNFILARLEKEKLPTSKEADRVTLIRRLSYDLLGLPPRPEEADAFVADKSSDAYEKLVERLLDSPHYGERWARHWLDVVRFAESDGFETNQPRLNAWPYRDYVIRAFNDDKPYDQFILEQLAGDALGEDAATGFIVGGPWDRVKSPDIGLTLMQRGDELHDMVSTTGSTFLGLTVGCARCHNHKFDPISQVDYYAMRAVFAGVQHGERALKSADYPDRMKRVGELRQQLKPVEIGLAQFEPMASLAVNFFLDDDPPLTSNPNAPRVTQLVPRLGLQPHLAGAGRGQADDPGDATRLPNLGKDYSFWSKVANRDVFAWEPKVAGRFRVWLSWGCGWNTHAPDARYILDLDGDLETKGDQIEIAKVDQRKFADGSGEVPGQPLWSGFYDAGVRDLRPESKIILRGGATDAFVTADVLLLQTVSGAETGLSATTTPGIRATVTRGKNVERFAPVEAKWVRFTISETTQLEPCLDELEVFSAGSAPRNVALASAGTKATASSTLPGYEIHKLEHVNDGLYGNDRSWISNERGKGWVQLEFPRTETIDRVVWSRDRDNVPRYNDRLPTNYKIEVSTDGQNWKPVASSADRLALNSKNQTGAIPTIAGLSASEAARLKELVQQRQQLEKQIKEATTTPMVYAGNFVKPETTHRLHRGDPMQAREPVAPGAVAEFGAKLQLPVDAPEQERRVTLAKWIADPRHPLTARVMVNRIWQHHFGEGLAATPSDFGLNGARPTHPELLDWLASEFVAHKWSVKAIHRLILLSSTYRQAGTPNAKSLEVDASSRLLWRFPPQRLEAEPIRDAILAVTGKLDLRVGGPGFDLFEPNSNYVKVYNSRKDFSAAQFRRMIYQSKPRMQLDDTFGTFDCPDAGQIAPRRTRSTTPLQALNLLNSRFMVQQAGFFAARVQTEAGAEVKAQVNRAFKLVFNRPPAAEELTASEKLVHDQGLIIFCRALLNANEFINVF